MDRQVAATSRKLGETAAHRHLKRLAVLWAQAQGYSACAAEVTLPQCRYRADVAAYRRQSNGAPITAVFECKQALHDLRKDNCSTTATSARLETVFRRQRILEKHLRVHYPNLRSGDSLFPEFESHDFAAIGHGGYTRVTREMNTLKKRLYAGTKFETLVRYHCANLFFLVLPNELFNEPQLPASWGALVECDGCLVLRRKPVWHETSTECRLRFLERIAIAGTRQLNRQLEISFDEIVSARAGR
jgi:hypothetical protein